MRTRVQRVGFVLSVGIAVATASTTQPPHAVAEDAGAVIETVQSRCMPTSDSWAARAADSTVRLLDCAAIYRNTADRSVFGIGIDVWISGQRGTVRSGDCLPKGSHEALAPGESGVLAATLAFPAATTDLGSVALSYRAAWTGDPSVLDRPKPELQYIDRVESGGHVHFVGEVRNVDGRTLRTSSDENCDSRDPILVYFDHGKLVTADETGRKPWHRIGPDGRYIFHTFLDLAPDLAIDAIQVVYRDAFSGVLASPSLDAHWQLIGLDHALETDPTGAQRMTFRVSVRNPTSFPSSGPVTVFVRRADFHAIGIGQCDFGNRIDVPPGAERSCSGTVEILEWRPGVTFDAVRFVTVDLASAVAFPLTPTPTPTLTPCPALSTPAPVPTLQRTAAIIWMPSLTRMLPEWCPAKP